MTKTAWTFSIPGFSASDIMSMQFSVGRRSIYDDFTTNFCTVQARNNNDQAYYLYVGAYCYVTTPNMALQSLGWWVAGWEYSDGYSPDECFVTIQLISNYGYLGRDTTNASIPGTIYTALDQVQYCYVTNNQRSGQPPYVDVPASGTQFAYTVPAGTNVGTFLQNAVRTEWGRVYEADQTVTFSALSGVGAFHINIGLNKTTTDLRWDSFSRSGANIDSFANVSATSTQGQYAVYYYGTTQQLSLTTNHATSPNDWVSAITRSISGRFEYPYVVDPPKQFVVTVTDGAQDANALSTLETALPYLPAATATLTYYDPRTGTTSYTCLVEGVDVESRPGVTTYRIYATEASGYPLFILDNTLLGVLDYNRLGF